jgi:hypothetical protein
MFNPVCMLNFSLQHPELAQSVQIPKVEKLGQSELKQGSDIVRD